MKQWVQISQVQPLLIDSHFFCQYAHNLSSSFIITGHYENYKFHLNYVDHHYDHYQSFLLVYSSIPLKELSW